MDLSGTKIEVTVPKEKKPRSAAQQAATVKALAALKARREAKEKEEQEVKDSKVLAKQKLRTHAKKSDDPVITKKQLDEALKAHAEMLKTATTPQVATLPPPPKPVAPSIRSESPMRQPEPPKQAVAPAPAPAPARPSTAERERLTGRALLDHIFKL
jgi:hypothetical protein